MLKRVDIHGVRNLHRVRIDGAGTTNVLYGDNGSGKTSVLEAIHLLGMARSFRSTSARSVISHGLAGCTVFAELQKRGQGAGGLVTIGVQRDRDGAATIKVGGQLARSVADLAAELPLLVINAESFDLLSGTPSARRQFLDWGVFHVEHDFLAAWKRFQRCLKQRNSLLRHDKIDTTQLAGWTRDLAAAGELITAARARYFAHLQPVFERVLAAILPDCPGVELRFRRGWDVNKAYAEALDDAAGSDAEQGYTHSGPQRADLRVTVSGFSAAETLSRGQQKLVVCALKLAQGHVLVSGGAAQGCTYLVDDLPSELDPWHTRLICEQLVEIGAQAFITCIDAADVRDAWPAAEPLTLFHVEHGRVSGC